MSNAEACDVTAQAATRGPDTPNELALSGMSCRLADMMEQAHRDLLLQALNDRTHDVEALDARMGRLQDEWQLLATRKVQLQADAAVYRQALQDGGAL